jgi:hypothetical protein
MSAIRGTYLNGTIVPDTQPAWAEGTRVSMDVASATEYPDDDESPDAIAKQLALMEAFEREPVMSDDDADAFERCLKENRKLDLDLWKKWTQEIEELFP